ncbi:DNA excision repair protein ERCC-6-like 2 [Pholidichthys leucotaenia]
MRLRSKSHDDDDVAWVTFTDHSRDAEQKVHEEEAIPVSKLMRPDLYSVLQEKPFFPSSVTHPDFCVPLELSDVDEDRVPYTINRYLRDYQREGIRFIYNNFIRSRGCILGDDMGLGKTVQVIGFLAAMLHKTGTWEDIANNRPQFLQSQMPSKQNNVSKVFLIVAPLSVLYNWKDELDTWGHFQCVVVHGLRKEEELTRIRRGRVEIALTTYETLRLCLDQFNKIDWSAVIVDEAHKIKNPNSQITQAMKDLRCKIRIGLTGTILQNNLEELWCVMDWAIPGCLGSLGHFKNKFSDPIEQGQRHSATKRTLATGRKTVRALGRMISHWFFRRTKALIKEQLPKKDDRVVYCSLTEFQQAVHKAVLDCEDVMLLLRSSEKCDCHSGRTRGSCCYETNSDGVRMKELYFSYLTILRKVANHVALLQSTPGTSKRQKKYVSAICAKVFQKFPDFVQRCKNEAFEALSDPMYSGKMKVLQKLLKHYLQKRDKVLIFSLSTKLLDVLESYCMAEGLDFSRLDGATKSKDRVQIVKDFNSSSHINLCLVSTMAGGLGLNFVGANVVVLFDPTWNPANDLQAIDRAYRIGQCRDVTVLRLISLGTVEEVIYLRQIYKQQLQSSVVGKESARRYFEAVQGHGVYKGELFGIKNLFRLQTQGTCLTRNILEREGQVEAGVMMSTHKGKENEHATGENIPKGTSPTEGPVPNDVSAKEKSSASEVSCGVLDFSSEEEEGQGLKKKSANTGAEDDHATTTAGRLGLLQCGLSRLLESIVVKPEREELDSSSGVEESPTEEDIDDPKREGSSDDNQKRSSTKNVLPKMGTKTLEKPSCSYRKHGGNADKERDNCGNNKITVNEENDENCSTLKTVKNLKTVAVKVPHFEGYSDESEDFDLEAKTTSHDREKDNEGRRLVRNKIRQSASVRDKARSKYTAEIETFTSSEDEGTTPGTEKTLQNVAMDTTKRGVILPKAVSFTNLKNQTLQTFKEKSGTIDGILGGVQEVVYTHSNQRVVGGSKAEELISRSAVRDVFERKMYSQLPANHLLSSQESLSAGLPESELSPATFKLQEPTVGHPITFTSKSVHHTRRSTVIIGETPKAVRRQQLEQMAELLKFPSVHQFAADVLSRNSAQRLDWLKQYYTTLNDPDLADAIKDNFPQPASEQAISSTSTKTTEIKCITETRAAQKSVLKVKKHSEFTQRSPEPMPQKQVSVPQKTSTNMKNECREPPKKQRISVENVREPRCDVPNPESEEREETVRSAKGCKRTKRGSVSTSGACIVGGGLGGDGASSSGLGSGEAAAALDCTDRDAPSSSDLSHGKSSVTSKPTVRGRAQEQKATLRMNETLQGQRENSQAVSTASSRSFLTDLIGDTSFLDDLLKSKPKTGQQRSTLRTPPTLPVSIDPSAPTASPSRICLGPDSVSHTQTWPQVSVPVQASKGSRKDIWDILNEGNEESINKLIDPEEVQRVCINTSIGARSVLVQNDSKSLWKTNEKFLWKK